jgi:acetylornithine deacetylase/succinyl-diaminopimelate desuccinylase-like protein
VLALPLPSLEDVGPSTLNIGQIHGGHAPNVIADKAEAQVLVRLVGDSAPVRAALLEAAPAWRKSTSRSRFPLCGCARWRDCRP